MLSTYNLSFTYIYHNVNIDLAEFQFDGKDVNMKILYTVIPKSDFWLFHFQRKLSCTKQKQTNEKDKHEVRLGKAPWQGKQCVSGFWQHA